MILGFFDCLLLIADGTAVSLVDEAFLFAAVDEFGTLVAEPFKLVLFLFKVYGIFTGFVFFIYGIEDVYKRQVVIVTASFQEEVLILS